MCSLRARLWQLFHVQLVILRSSTLSRSRPALPVIQTAQSCILRRHTPPPTARLVTLRMSGKRPRGRFVPAAMPIRRTTIHKQPAEIAIRFVRRPRNNSRGKQPRILSSAPLSYPWQRGVDLRFCAGEKISLSRLSALVVRDNEIIIFFLDLGIDAMKACPTFGRSRDRASTSLGRSLVRPYFLGNFFLGRLNR
jgi:hypothetical protein